MGVGLSCPHPPCLPCHCLGIFTHRGSRINRRACFPGLYLLVLQEMFFGGGRLGLNSRSSVSCDITTRWLWKRWASCSICAFTGLSTAADVPNLTHSSDQTLLGTLLGARHLGYALSRIWITEILHCTLLGSSVHQRKAGNLSSKM